jgi:prolyl oligopeptidase
LAAAITFGFSACKNSSKTNETPYTLSYPDTKKVDTIDTYFGLQIADPYRWLEDDRSEETENWVKAQNEVTFDYLEAIPFRKEITERMTEMWNYERISAPFKEGKYTYYYKNDGLQNQSVIYRKNNATGITRYRQGNRIGL